MTDKELKDLVRGVLADAVDVNDKDTVMAAMFGAGVPFGKLNGLYRSVGVAEGHIVDPKVLNDNIKAALSSAGVGALPSFAEYGSIGDYCTSMAADIKGATSARVEKHLRDFCNENDIAMAKKPCTRTRTAAGGVVTEKVIGYANATDTMTRQGMYDAIVPYVKAPKNAYEYTNLFFNVALACKTGISLADALEAVKEMPAVVQHESPGKGAAGSNSGTFSAEEDETM